MCNNSVTITLPDSDGSLAPTKIDACLVGMILALNNAGIRTHGCCCGHREQRGYVKLADKRVMVIFDMSVEPDEAALNRALNIIPVTGD